MPAFTGTLKSNEIFAALYNMIISQEVFADNIAGTNSALVDKARVDGGLYGDTKLYYAVDVTKSAPWGNDAEAQNLLELHRPAAPKQQAITLDQFRQISLTVDEYLSKRAWGTASAFSQFNSVILGTIRDTKRVYDSTYYNAFFGTDTSTKETENVTINLVDELNGLTGLDKARMEATVIAREIADLIDNLTDVSRDYNDYGFLRSYDESAIKIVWNKKWLNKLRKVDLPTIFHKDGLIDKFGGDSLPARYFGEVTTTSGTVEANSGRRSLIEKDCKNGTHVFPGDLLPTGETFGPGETYIADESIVCKVIVKLPPYMSAFEVGTSFFNPKSLTTNHYLTWGYNTLEHFANYPMITVKTM